MKELEAVRKLQSRGIFVDSSSRLIDLGSMDGPGLSSWGLIDFLCHYCKYRWIKA